MTLTPQEQKLYDFMSGHGADVDVRIADIFRVVIGPPKEDHRAMHQRLGNVLSSTNGKLKRNSVRERIIPGQLKRTYRLTMV
jgi:hypothetical protein